MRLRRFGHFPFPRGDAPYGETSIPVGAELVRAMWYYHIVRKWTVSINLSLSKDSLSLSGSGSFVFEANTGLRDEPVFTESFMQSETDLAVPRYTLSSSQGPGGGATGINATDHDGNTRFITSVLAIFFPAQPVDNTGYKFDEDTGLYHPYIQMITGGASADGQIGFNLDSINNADPLPAPDVNGTFDGHPFPMWATVVPVDASFSCDITVTPGNSGGANGFWEFRKQDDTEPIYDATTGNILADKTPYVESR